MNLIIATALMMAPAFAQNTTDPKTTSGMTTSTTTTTNTGAYTTLSDAQIADVVRTANKGEIDSSKHAKSRATHKEVKAFAKMMIDHHEKSNKETKNLLSKLKLKAETNDLSHTLEASVKEEMDKLKKLKGADYDKAYMQAQLNMHQTVLTSIEQSLLPSAKNAEVKTMLEKTRDTVASHLDEAKRINGQL